MNKYFCSIGKMNNIIMELIIFETFKLIFIIYWLNNLKNLKKMSSNQVVIIELISLDYIWC